jgi:hypothetical protein
MLISAKCRIAAPVCADLLPIFSHNCQLVIPNERFYSARASAYAKASADTGMNKTRRSFSEGGRPG